MRKTILLAIGSVLSVYTYGQQQAMYTQYMFNMLAINPAYASIDENLAVTGLTRHQWVGFKGAPRTQTLSVHSPVGTSNTFVGGMVINDQIGEVLRQTGAYFTLAQRVELSEGSYLSVGVDAGASTISGSFSDLYSYSPESVNDPVFANSNSIVGDFGFGVMLFSERYYVGFSSPNFYQRDFTNYNRKTAYANFRAHYLLQGGALLTTGYDVKFKPSFLLKYVNGSPLQVDLNANFLLKESLWLGASYRSGESFGALASVLITPTVQLGYSYDFVNTALAKAQSGSHEIVLKFSFAVKGRDRMACYF